MTQLYLSLFSFPNFLKVKLTAFPFIPAICIHSPLHSIVLNPWLPPSGIPVFTCFCSPLCSSLSYIMPFFSTIMSHSLLIAINFWFIFLCFRINAKKRMESWEGWDDNLRNRVMGLLGGGGQTWSNKPHSGWRIWVQMKGLEKSRPRAQKLI